MACLETWGHGRLFLGAEVAGKVVIGETGLPALGAQVIVTPSLAIAPRKDEVARRRSLNLTATTDEHGHFVVNGLEPGSYEIKVTASGFATATMSSVTVVERSLTELRHAISLQRPLALNVAVAPPQDPAGHPWTLELKEAGIAPGVWQSRFRATVSDAGSVSCPDLPPGTYRAALYDSAGMTMLMQKHELNESTTRLELSVASLLVTGVVKVGERPLQARLTFMKSDSGARVEVHSDEAGEFFSNLPGDGVWSVRVTSSSPTVKRVVRNVRIAADESGAATVELVLPATMIEGSVVKAGKMPVAGADVRVVQPRNWSDNSQTTTDSDGRFSIGAAAEGRLEVYAQHHDQDGTWTSERVPVQVTESQTPPPIILLLHPDNELTGRVLSHLGQGVPRAVVYAYSTDFQEALARPLEQTVTDASGAFRLRTPMGVSSVYVTVFAPGFSLRAFRRVVSERTPMEVRVEPFGGSLVLDLGAVFDSLAAASTTFVVFQDDALVPQSLIFGWLRAQGLRSSFPEPLLVPMMAMGNYRLCMIDLTQPVAAAPQAGSAASSCSGGVLAPAGSLTLTGVLRN